MAHSGYVSATTVLGRSPGTPECKRSVHYAACPAEEVAAGDKEPDEETASGDRNPDEIWAALEEQKMQIEWIKDNQARYQKKLDMFGAALDRLQQRIDDEIQQELGAVRHDMELEIRTVKLRVGDTRSRHQAAAAEMQQRLRSLTEELRLGRPEPNQKLEADLPRGRSIPARKEESPGGREDGSKSREIEDGRTVTKGEESLEDDKMVIKEESSEDDKETAIKEESSDDDMGAAIKEESSEDDMETAPLPGW